MDFSKSRKLFGEYQPYVFPVLDFVETIAVSGKGSFVVDADGNRLLDLNSGQFCAVFGHSNDELANHVSSIACKLQDTNTLMLNDSFLSAAKALHDICPEMNGRVLLLSTGAEANECALRYAKHLNNNKTGIICFDRAYHGQSHGTEGYSYARKHVKPPVDDTFVVPVPRGLGTAEANEEECENCLRILRDTVDQNYERIAAGIFEPIVSSGGMYFPPKRYFSEMRRIFDEYGIYLIFDEAQTGFGRTGTWFYYQKLDCVPDIMTCSKGIGLGYPVSAVVFNGDTIPDKSLRMHQYSSHQNDPFASEIVMYAIQYMKDHDLLERITEKGKLLFDGLRRIQQDHRSIRNVRGIGLMGGFDLNVDEPESLTEGPRFCRRMLNEGALVQECNSGKTIRILPNYLVNDDEIDLFCDALENVLSKGNEQ